jgi:signal transduction histidine kinase
LVVSKANPVDLVARIEAIPTILEVVCRTTGMGFAAVARVTEDRWIACGVRDEIDFGLAPGGELKVETTICNEVRDALEPVAISDVAGDPAFCHHPTPAMYGFRSYVSTPIVLPGGEVFGTLCALDRTPRDLSSPWLVGMFRMFAELIAFHVDVHERLMAGASELAASQAELAVSRADLASRTETLDDERATSELREQFIAVLGHDLRNPLASIDAGMKLLARENLSERGRGILELVGKSVGRMAGLIDDVLDFARGRLGGGITVEKTDKVPLAPMLRQVVDEIRGSHPSRRIDADFDGIAACRCDPARIGQLLSNLVANAVTHGGEDTSIQVRGVMVDGGVELTVTNGGKPIPPEAMANLFKPFVRAFERPSQQGLGLGLYIASEIAKAHDGTLVAASDTDATTFRFRMPA